MPVLAEGAKQDAVQKFLRAAENFLRGNGGIFATQAGKHGLPEMGVKGVKLVSQLAADGLGLAVQVMEMAFAGVRNHAWRA